MRPEDKYVKLPAIIHATRLGYGSLRTVAFDSIS